MKNRVVEHNIRIMAKYYTKVTLKRMSELLDLKVDETEDFLSKMVSIFLFTFLIILHIYVSFSLQMIVSIRDYHYDH